VPQTDQHQTVRVLAVKAPVKTQMTQEPEYGDRMMYAEIQNSASNKAEFTLEDKITRREYSRGDYAHLQQADQKPSVVSAPMSRLRTTHFRPHPVQLNDPRGGHSQGRPTLRTESALCRFRLQAALVSTELFLRHASPGFKTGSRRLGGK